ncbi:RHS repeat-containing protein [Amycolatopsis mediterranei S699]|uniref:RHS repeat-containing protein n=2 Tax=Amycolatopsis mediterranei TaxID=33910 RepID=A0A0H3CZ29_AMYMU|nr:RHS repeat-associated core domain-containing protein [Amycolatopsis mediterranei]ADJ43887.1 RHS repeat-containing protein [Amycolatopsis mediterranei U32]AEK40605.1 RHS repeat-containing protein [Amycolatopsis mediterranei S699]AFO75600.1 RHS repeat-containing protein [Amycolatopsis mediterranei S699]AGT82729.1 RHS repeat-containing protein [Amycolatopsis mediterranei RB]KDO09106.1 type IV secretion protein Rhs [Amycolatopsis mediterranei]
MLRTITFVSAGALIAAVPATASAAPRSGQDGVPLPVSWTPPAQVNRTPTGVLADQVPVRPAPRSGASVQSLVCDTTQSGTQPWFAMDRYAISDRTELLVNRYSGNAVITDRALTVKGTGLNMSVDAVYNSANLTRGGAFGTFWTVSGGPDVKLVIYPDPDRRIVLYDPTGYCAEFTKNDDGSYATPSGMHATLTKLPDGKYALSQDSSGETKLFTGDGRLFSQADRNGHTITYRYNASDGTLASITDTQGRVTTTTYGNSRITAVTDPAGVTAGAYGYDGNGHLTKITNRNGDSMNFGLDANGRITTLTTTLGRSYTLSYDAGGRVTQVTEPNYGGVASVTGYAYGSGTTTVTDPNGHKSTYTFDDGGRQTKATDALGHSRNQGWSAHGDVNSLTDATGNSVTYDYDPLNNLKGGKLPTGATMSAGYTDTAHPHLPTQVADFSGNKVNSTYDKAGNVTKVHSDALNADVASYEYSTGLVTKSTDGNGHATTYGYDTAGNLTTVTPPLPLKPTTYTYDSLSRVTSVTDGNGVKLVYGYDKLDHVVSVAKADGTGLAAYTYDQTGNRTVATTAGATLTNSYERRLLTRVVRTAGTGSQTATYHYDQAGNVTAVDDPTGWIYYGYDAADRLTSVKDQANTTTTYGYDNSDHRTSATLPGGSTETIGVDKSGRQTGITVKNSAGSTLLSTSYRYTKPDGTDTGQVQSRTDSTGTADNTYDGFGRLTKAGGRTYAYDNAGNITAGDGRTYTVNDADQMTKIDTITAGYDGAGNLTTTNPGGDAHYSDTNQLTSVTSSSGTLFSGSYDTLDQTQAASITERVGSGDVTHVFTRTALGISRTVDNGAATTYAHDVDGNLTGLVDAAGKHHNAITDYQGSVLALVDDTGVVTATYTYTPYGFNTGITGPAGSANRLRWLGSYQLASSEYLTGYRHYNPAYARFTQPDPTGQENNAYAYGKGDPINHSDPNGDYGFADLGQDIGSYAGGAMGVALGAAICAGTAGAGCLIGAVSAGVIFGGVGGGAGALIGGGDSGKVRDGFISGAIGGGLGALGGGGWKLLKRFISR